MEKDFSELPKTPVLSPWQRLFYTLLAPFAAIRHAIVLPYKLRIQENCIKRPAPAVRNKVARISKDISRSAFKKATEAAGCSVNEALHSLIGVTLKEYSERRGQKDLNEITIASSFALRGFPTSPEGVTLGNHWAPMPMKLPVSHSFSDNVRINKENNKKMKASTQVLGMSTFLGWNLMLPFELPKAGFNFLARRITLTYSNIPSPVVNYNFGGVKCRAMCGFLPSVGDMLCGIIGISHGALLKLSLITDTHYIEHPDEFMHILDTKV